MDFPSSKCFCSTAGQIRPQQHAWPRTTAAHPQQLRPGRSQEAGASSRGQRGAPGGWDGHARACRGVQKITSEAVQRINREATEKVT